MTVREMLTKNLAYYREESGHTQKSAAEALKTRPTTISSWERGVSQPSADMLVEIALLYKVPLSVLCGIDYDMKYTAEEMELIKAFRNHPEHQASIRVLLGVREKKDNLVQDAAV